MSNIKPRGYPEHKEIEAHQVEITDPNSDMGRTLAITVDDLYEAFKHQLELDGFERNCGR